jgi:hypothetical protein
MKKPVSGPGVGKMSGKGTGTGPLKDKRIIRKTHSTGQIYCHRFTGCGATKKPAFASLR